MGVYKLPVVLYFADAPYPSALQDPRMIDVLGVLMGVDMQGFSRPEGSEELPPGVSSSSIPRSSPSRPTPSTSTSKPTSTPAPPPEDVEMEDEDEDAKAKKEAETTKKAGSEAYKKRDFDEAARLFSKAWDVWPKDITFLTNLGGGFRPLLSVVSALTSQSHHIAVYFEQGDYDKAIETCEKAVDEGRSVSPSQSLPCACLTSFFSFAPITNWSLKPTVALAHPTTRKAIWLPPSNSSKNPLLSTARPIFSTSCEKLSVPRSRLTAKPTLIQKRALLRAKKATCCSRPGTLQAP